MYYVCTTINNNDMTTKEFLTANKEEVITFFNTEIKNSWNVSLKDFMTDLLNNFRKITKGEDYKKFDLMGNLQEAKSRLGLMTTKIEVAFDRDAYIKAKYKGTAFEQTLAL